MAHIAPLRGLNDSFCGVRARCRAEGFRLDSPPPPEEKGPRPSRGRYHKQVSCSWKGNFSKCCAENLNSGTSLAANSTSRTPSPKPYTLPSTPYEPFWYWGGSILIFPIYGNYHIQPLLEVSIQVMVFICGLPNGTSKVCTPPQYSSRTHICTHQGPF